MNSCTQPLVPLKGEGKLRQMEEEKISMFQMLKSELCGDWKEGDNSR